MSVRDELLLRSMVCVLDKMTRHEWRCRESKPQLTIVQSKQQADPGGAQGHDDTLVTMTVGDGTAAEALRLRLPLHPADLQDKLNRAGSMILGERSLDDDSSTMAALPPHRPAPPPEPAARPPDIAGTGIGDPDERLQLSRWPAASLLASPRHMRAATLLLKTPMTISRICAHSGLTEPECIQFVAALRHHRLLQPPRMPNAIASLTTSPVPDTEKTRARIGLLGLIRRKLGLQP